jgi:hypothetical protein
MRDEDADGWTHPRYPHPFIKSSPFLCSPAIPMSRTDTQDVGGGDAPETAD